jgi:phosphohistidine phosphatase SixA
MSEKMPAYPLIIARVPENTRQDGPGYRFTELTNNGRVQAKRLAAALKKGRVMPSHVLSYRSKAANQTADILAEAFPDAATEGVSPPHENLTGRLPFESPMDQEGPVAGWLARLPEGATPMIILHAADLREMGKAWSGGVSENHHVSSLRNGHAVLMATSPNRLRFAPSVPRAYFSI